MGSSPNLGFGRFRVPAHGFKYQSEFRLGLSPGMWVQVSIWVLARFQALSAVSFSWSQAEVPRTPPLSYHQAIRRKLYTLQTAPDIYAFKILLWDPQGVSTYKAWATCFPSLTFFFFYWSIVDLQCCVNFWCSSKWFSDTYTHIHSFSDY